MPVHFVPKRSTLWYVIEAKHIIDACPEYISVQNEVTLKHRIEAALLEAYQKGYHEKTLNDVVKKPLEELYDNLDCDE